MQRRWRSFLLLLSAGAFLMPCTGAEPAAPGAGQKSEPKKATYRCRYMGEQTVEIDGKPDEAAWNLAHAMKDFRVLRNSTELAKYKTTVRLVWNDEHLYLSFVCANDGIRSEATTRDEPVWEGETAEMFICPRGPDAFYYEINFTPNNVVFDSRIESWKYRDMVKDWKKWAAGFNAAIKSATQVERDGAGKVTGWSLEAAIPFKDLDVAGRKAPKPGDTWLFNVFRIAVKQDGKIEYSMWQTVHPEFHRPHQFPQLLFAGRE